MLYNCFIIIINSVYCAGLLQVLRSACRCEGDGKPMEVTNRSKFFFFISTSLLDLFLLSQILASFVYIPLPVFKRKHVDLFPNPQMYLWLSLCTLHLPACQASVTIWDSGCNVQEFRASKSNYVKRLCLVVPLVSRP